MQDFVTALCCDTQHLFEAFEHHEWKQQGEKSLLGKKIDKPFVQTTTAQKEIALSPELSL